LAEASNFVIELNGNFIRAYTVEDTSELRHFRIVDGGQNPETGSISGSEMLVLGLENPVFEARVAPPGYEEVPRSLRLVVRCTPEAYQWVRGLSDFIGLDITATIWQALIRQAEGTGYHTRVPQRYRRKPRTPTPSVI
jgi:hypothetical protein